jgi:SPP1 gp7 family putative phage head morphogenesis protein
MKVFGWELKKADPEITSKPQIGPGGAQGQMTSWFNSQIFRKVSGGFYEVLREGIPVIDGAIRRLISLNGTIKPIGDNMDIVKELEDFSLNVPVNDMQKGIHAFLENGSNETFEQGFSISEFIATKDLKDIEGLRVADSKNIVFRKNAKGKAEPWYRPPGQLMSSYSLPADAIEKIINAKYGETLSLGGIEETKLNMSNKLYFSINNENTDPHGVSIMRSLEFVSQIFITLENSLKNVAERFGDPAYHVHYKSSKAGKDIKTRREDLQNDFNDVINAKRAGKSADLVTAGDPNSEVVITVIGHDGQIIEYEIPFRHVVEQIVAKVNLPAWMIGYYWSTTERMATLEVETVLQDAKIRQLAMLPEFLRLFSAYLKIRGFKWDTITTDPDKPGDWGLMFETPNLRDMVSQAQARFLNAQADMMEGNVQTQTTVNVGAASNRIQSSKLKSFKIKDMEFECGCGNKSHHPGKKELSRSEPWPELDEVEQKYEDELKYDWEEFMNKVFEILNLSEAKGQKQDIPDIDAFTFSSEQRQAIMDDLENYIGQYDFRDTDSAVRFYYGQAYSLGLIQAAKLIGQERPILDIIKNSEVFEEIASNGFTLLKDNATKAIVDKIIPEVEAQVLAGSNPRHVADRLKKLFGDQNSDWERLARSEMTLAAESAKGDEWKEQGIKKLEFSPAPDAYPICEALAGDYDIDKCPLPVADTHPRCRCGRRPVASEG